VRVEAYRVFEIVAWPAAAWCAIELAMRAATAEFAGSGATLVSGVMAALMIAGCRLRTAQLRRVQ